MFPSYRRGSICLSIYLSVTVVAHSAKTVVLVGPSGIELDTNLSHHRSDQIIRDNFLLNILAATPLEAWFVGSYPSSIDTQLL